MLSKVEFSVTLPTDYQGGWLIEIVVCSRGLAVDAVVCDTTLFWLMYETKSSRCRKYLLKCKLFNRAFLEIFYRKNFCEKVYYGSTIWYTIAVSTLKYIEDFRCIYQPTMRTKAFHIS